MKQTTAKKLRTQIAKVIKMTDSAPSKLFPGSTVRQAKVISLSKVYSKTV
ncbi:hypothetical protein [Flavitalea sp.]|nr:hypothetical protein [Flavitalea sp.]